MPTYDYRCHTCGHEMEVFESITASPQKECPQCQSPSLQRGIGGGSATFCFRGTGFYITDHKKSCSHGSTPCCPCKPSPEVLSG